MANTQMQQPGVAACNRLIATIERSLAMEQTSRPTGDDTIRVPWLRYALAQFRQRIAPALSSGLEHDPVHVVMFGGTNSGKSTALNVLLGCPAAGMSYRARFSQHPVAFCPAGQGPAFVDLFPTRFTSYKRYTDQAPPQRSDKDLRELGYEYALAVVDLHHLTYPTILPPASQAAVYWDIPDFSTEEASIYMPAVLDTVALADLVVMTVTKENYADHRGNLLRGMICGSGVPMRVVANKLEDGSRLLDDIAMKLADSDDGTCRVPADRLHPLPHVVDTDEQGRLEKLARSQEGSHLRTAVAGDVALGVALKQRALGGAIIFLERRLDDLLAPLKAELAAVERWGQMVDRATRNDFYARYQQDYLNGETYVDFNQTLIKLLDLLEVPGIGPIISAASKALRSLSSIIFGPAISVVRGFFSKGEPNTGTPEKDAVATAFERWLHTLRSEAQVLAERRDHPAWGQIALTLGDYPYIMDLARQVGAAYLGYRDKMNAVTDQRAQALYEIIRTNPALLHALRGLKLALDAGTTSLIIASHGLNWTDAVIAPLVIPVQRLLLEFGLEKYMDVQKAKLKQEQLAALREMAETHMVAPVRQLFVGAVSPGEMAQARSDFAEVSRAIRRRAGV